VLYFLHAGIYLDGVKFPGGKINQGCRRLDLVQV
jgi:hypothetical protein